MDRQQIMQKALNFAKENIINKRWGPVACIIVKDWEIVYSSANELSENWFDPTAHAEISTIREFCKQNKIRECSWYELYVTSEPCPMCLWAIYWASFDKVYYCNTIDDANNERWIDKKIYQDMILPNIDRNIKCIKIDNPDWKKLFEYRNDHLNSRPDLVKYVDTIRNSFEKRK